MLADLARREINELHVEAGHQLNGSLLRAGLVDELLVYLAPSLLGEGARHGRPGTLARLEVGRAAAIQIGRAGRARPADRGGHCRARRLLGDLCPAHRATAQSLRKCADVYRNHHRRGPHHCSQRPGPIVCSRQAPPHQLPGALPGRCGLGRQHCHQRRLHDGQPSSTATRSCFSVDISAESLACTAGLDTLGSVNLEKALRANDRLGGHIGVGPCRWHRAGCALRARRRKLGTAPGGTGGVGQIPGLQGLHHRQRRKPHRQPA